MIKEEKTLTTEEIFNGNIIRLRRDIVELPNKKQSSREVVMHPGGVSVVALDQNNRVCMVRQYRKPHEKVLLEIPAGKLNWGEDHFECAKRELKEETGYSAENYTYLGGYYPSPGFCDEIIHIYLATNLEKGAASPDEDEFLEVESYPLDELVEMVMDGCIKDAKTAIAILKTKLILNKNQIGNR